MTYANLATLERPLEEGRVFETFNVHEKFGQLLDSLDHKGFSDFNDSHIIVAVPTLDESMRDIKTFDEALFFAQQDDAQLFCELLEFEITDSLVNHISSPEGLARLANKESFVDHLILLHEFETAEEDNIIGVLKRNGMNDGLKVYKLY